MNTREALEIVAAGVPKETAFIASLGRTSEEAFRLFPNQTLFLDSMGDVSSVACGVALGLGAVHPVVALDTDGSHLMGITLIPTLAAMVNQLSNLLIIVFDNGIYESGGGLPSRDVELNWYLLGQAFGITIQVVRNREEFETALKSAFKQFLYVVVEIENLEGSAVSSKSLDGIESKYRFTRHLEQVVGRSLLKPAVKS
jgi:thiamine pyrophosphate-dependent acetolactate synthase large subunit-like protein